MLLGEEEDREIRRRLRLIHLLHLTNPYPQPQEGGTASQRRRRRVQWRRRWLQIIQLAERIFLYPDPPPNSDPLSNAVEQLNQLTIAELPEPPINPFTNPASSVVDSS
ncbi:rev protein [Simian immunodeficiency virus]|uniref:Protein Rev n=1 Tax=Simian immunodeficiency virus TaxID=11723 RepID=E1ANV2_SIV|nr:rev protein [Simian immunodeficiency virus]